MPGYEHLTYEQDGPVTVITIDRPDRMNAIGPRTHRELVDAWERFRDDPEASVAVLTGAGDTAFSAGGDLKAALDGEQMSFDPDEPGVLGPSRWTDLAIADEHATFGVTCRRWNIGLADGGTQRLPRIVGMRRALELIITGRVIDAEEALRIGLVNEVVPSGTCRARAQELAHEIAALPQPAIRTDKEAAVRGFGRPLDEGLRIEAECFNRLIDGPEMAEGLRRFNERDHPDRIRGGIPGRD